MYLDWTTHYRYPDSPAEWFDLLGEECFSPGTTREELERKEVAHVCDIYWARILKEQRKKDRSLLPQIIAAFDLMLAIAAMIISRETASAKSFNTHVPVALSGGHVLVHIELTPRLLAQRPIAARVRAGTLT